MSLIWQSWELYKEHQYNNSMMNETPNYPYLAGFLGSSMTAENILMRMKHNHNYDTGSESEQEELRLALDLACKAILKEADEGAQEMR